MHLRGYIPMAVLGIVLLIGSTAHAASLTDYTTARAKVSVTALGPTDQITSQFPGRAGQIIEVEGVVDGVFTSNGATGFLLQVDPSQTLILTTSQQDGDISIANKLQVLARIPTAGTVLDAVSLTRLNALAAGTPATATPNTDHTCGNLIPPSTMPVEHRPPVIYYQGARDDTTVPYASGAGLAQQPEVVQRYAQKIRQFNSRISEDMATNIAFYILDKSERYNVDPRLTMALVAQESRFNPEAVSRTGAQGLGQLMPSTASLLGVHNSFSIADNLDGSVRYLHDLLQQFGRVPLALAAYNAGPNSVKRYGGVPPYRETQNYVQVIWANYTSISNEIVN